MDKQSLLKQYVSIVQKVAKIEQRRVPNHMIEYEELVSIGIIAVQAMIKGKTEEQLQKDIMQIVRKNFFASVDRAPWTFVNIYTINK